MEKKLKQENDFSEGSITKNILSMAVPVTIAQAVQLMFGESGIVPAAFVAILLNVILPKSKPANEETSKDE